VNDVPDASAPRPSTTVPAVDSSLQAYTTLRLGGPAGSLAVVEETDEVTQTVRRVAAGSPVLVLAGGSNVVIGEDGFPGTVVLLRTRGSRIVSRVAAPDPDAAEGDGDGDVVTVRVAAGEPWDDFVAETVANGWSGVECLSGIPGSAGATPIQNVGAYGQEVADTIAAVRVYDRLDDTEYVMTPQQCRFAYRGSVFKHSDRWVVLEVDFRLTASGMSVPIRYAELARSLGVDVGARVPLALARETVRSLRAGKGMVLDAADPDTYSVGSFFTNPVLAAPAFAALRERAADIGEPPSWAGADGTVKVSAAWLIERAGFHKGYAGAQAGVSISTKHTLALTNRGTGTVTALLGLAREIRDGVQDRFGVVLHPEPVLVNCEL
jgi:UDP-N-acetylmuramate dehydrogenase